MLTVLLALLPAASATHVQTFEVDPLYTKAPWSGLEQLIVDPAQTKIVPRSAPIATNNDVYKNQGDSRTLGFTNPTSTWAWITINDVKIGTIGPYAVMKLEGMSPGWYTIVLDLPTGAVMRYAVQVE